MMIISTIISLIKSFASIGNSVTSPVSCNASSSAEKIGTKAMSPTCNGRSLVRIPTRVRLSVLVSSDFHRSFLENTITVSHESLLPKSRYRTSRVDEAS